jgi:hypothetical protein
MFPFSDRESRSPHRLHHKSLALLRASLQLASTILRRMILDLLSTQEATIQNILSTRLLWMHLEEGPVSRPHHLRFNNRGRGQMWHQHEKQMMRHVEKIPCRRSGSYSTERHARSVGNRPTVPDIDSVKDPRPRSFRACRVCKLLKTDKT